MDGKEDPRKRQGVLADQVMGCCFDSRMQYLWDITVTHNDFDYMQKVGRESCDQPKAKLKPQQVLSNSVL